MYKEGQAWLPTSSSLRVVMVLGNVCSPLEEKKEEENREGRKRRIKNKAKRKRGSGLGCRSQRLCPASPGA